MAAPDRGNEVRVSTEHPNVAAARGLWSAVAEGDASALRGMLSPDVVWRSMGQHPLSGEYRGPDAVLDYLATIGETADHLVSTLDAIFVGDAGAVVAYHVSAARGDRRLEMDYLLRLRIRDGQVVHAISVPLDQRTNDAFWR
jgi:ketosteroid isomerase-like protein